MKIIYEKLEDLKNFGEFILGFISLFDLSFVFKYYLDLFLFLFYKNVLSFKFCLLLKHVNLSFSIFYNNFSYFTDFYLNTSFTIFN